MVLTVVIRPFSLKQYREKSYQRCSFSVSPKRMEINSRTSLSKFREKKKECQRPFWVVFTVGSMSTGVFERRMSTGSGFFSFLGSCFAHRCRVLNLAIFPAIHKNKFPQIKITTNIFPAKIYSRVNIL